MKSSSILEEPRPWPFSRAQLTAGLRKYTGDNRLSVREIKEFDLPERRPSIGRIRGIHVVCQTSIGGKTYDLVLKEPQGTTRTGMAGAGRREVSFYHCLGEQIPLEIPNLLAAQPDGDWMLFERLTSGVAPETWKSDEYLLAIENIVLLHERFWGLEEFLDIYNWLGRPLSRDLEIYIQAASNGIEQLDKSSPIIGLTEDPSLLKMLEGLIAQTTVIAKELASMPCTLVHGDYWPGNLVAYPDGRMAVYDWQHVSIGPGILDLVKFFQASRWGFEPLPVSQIELVTRYREKLVENNGYIWQEGEWLKQWDYALLWIFLTDWVDLLAKIPAPVLKTRKTEIASIWLEPVTEAYHRWLKES
jgi:hypothetical protein